jgi:hypothetical protein
MRVQDHYIFWYLGGDRMTEPKLEGHCITFTKDFVAHALGFKLYQKALSYPVDGVSKGGLDDSQGVSVGVYRQMKSGSLFRMDERGPKGAGRIKVCKIECHHT